jgi:hypothetical protein
MKDVQNTERKVVAELSGGGASSTSKDLTTENMAKVLVAKKQSRAMGMAMSPGKQMMMNAFMLFMSGKSLNIFSISVTGQAIMTPLKVTSSFRNHDFNLIIQSRISYTNPIHQIPSYIFRPCWA